MKVLIMRYLDNVGEDCIVVYVISDICLILDNNFLWDTCFRMQTFVPLSFEVSVLSTLLNYFKQYYLCRD